jgi:hypothetical protein
MTLRVSVLSGVGVTTGLREFDPCCYITLLSTSAYTPAYLQRKSGRRAARRRSVETEPVFDASIYALMASTCAGLMRSRNND